ncbi:MAG: hypothetical protein IPP01_06625 [Saprospiraceae bacterium]|nr:hypothetical protein [Saprospiraceae bacterium]
MDGKNRRSGAQAGYQNSLKHFGADHYIKARERGYVVRGGHRYGLLRALANLLRHPVAAVWDVRPTTFYVQNNYPDIALQSELERVEGGFGVTPRVHFSGPTGLAARPSGPAILDNDGMNRQSSVDGRLTLRYWRRATEAETIS